MAEKPIVPARLGELATLLGDGLTVATIFVRGEGTRAPCVAVLGVVIDADDAALEVLAGYPGDVRDLDSAEQAQLLQTTEGAGVPREAIPGLDKAEIEEGGGGRFVDYAVAVFGSGPDDPKAVRVSLSTATGAAGAIVAGASVNALPVDLPSGFLLLSLLVGGVAGKVIPEWATRRSRARAQERVNAYAASLGGVVFVGYEPEDGALLEALNEAARQMRGAVGRLAVYGLSMRDEVDRFVAAAEAAVRTTAEIRELEPVVREEESIVARGSAAGHFDRDVDRVRRTLDGNREALTVLYEERGAAVGAVSAAVERLEREATAAEGRIDAAAYDAGSGGDIERQLPEEEDRQEL